MPTTRIIVLLYLHRAQKYTGLVHQITFLMAYNTTKELALRPEAELCQRKHLTAPNELKLNKTKIQGKH